MDITEAENATAQETGRGKLSRSSGTMAETAHDSSASTMSRSNSVRDIEKQDFGENRILDDPIGLQPSKDEAGPAGETRPDGEEDGHGEVPDEDVFPVGGDGLSSAVNRVLSRISHNSKKDPGPPPDGGWQAWTIGMAKLSEV